MGSISWGARVGAALRLPDSNRKARSRSVLRSIRAAAHLLRIADLGWLAGISRTRNDLHNLPAESFAPQLRTPGIECSGRATGRIPAGDVVPVVAEIVMIVKASADL